MQNTNTVVQHVRGEEEKKNGNDVYKMIKTKKKKTYL